MSNLLSQASLVMIPSGYKEDVVYSQIPTDGSGDLSFTRASNGTRVNSAGLVEVVAWNLLQNSENFSAVWTAYQSTITSNTATAPNGTLTADSLTDNSGNDVHIAYQTMAGIVAGTYTISVYAKASTLSHINLQLYDGTTFYTSNAFNLSNGTTTGANQSIESVGNGWYRCIFTSTTTVSGTQYAYVLLNNGTSNFYTGTGSGAVYIWGAQLNIGSTAKPYFPTTDRLNVPRLTYQNGGGGCPSLLLEKQSTNYAIYSEDLTQSATTLSGGTVGANVTTSPDGTQNADSFTVNTATSGHSGYYESYNGTNGSPFTTSIFLKAGTGRYFLFRAMTDNYGTRFGATIDLQTGTILSTNTAGSPTGTSSKIENVGNGWYRVSLTINSIGSQMSYVWATSNTATPSLDVYLDYSYTGNGTDSYYIWGMTLENSSYPTSYIPTTSSSATRVADACSKTGISSLIGQTEGVFYAEFTMPETQSPSFFSISDGTTGNRILFGYYLGALRYYADSATGAFAVGGVIDASPVVGQVYKIAVAYKANDFVVYKNGTNTNTLTTFTIPASLTQMDNAAGNAGQNIYASVKEILLFKTRLTNAELASLTTL